MTDSPFRRTGLPLGIAVLVLAAAVAYLGVRVHALERFARGELALAREAVARTERNLQLLRLEATTELHGAAAIIEQIETFAPELVLAATAAPVAQGIRERIDRALDAAEALGPDALPALESAFAKSTDSEARKWLLSACVRADRERGARLCASVVRGTRHDPDPQTRLRAADILLEVDRDLAGEVLESVLKLESAIGLRRAVPTALAAEYEGYDRGARLPSYYIFIGRYVASGDPDVESTLLELIHRDDHDRMTYQECTKELAKLRSHQAVRRIEELFESPPFGVRDPLFQNICLQALADIQGVEACSFFDRMLREPQAEIVETKLQTLLKQLQG